MLAKPDVKVAFDESGKAIGVTSEGQTAKAKLVSNASCCPSKQALGSQSIPLPTSSITGLPEFQTSCHCLWLSGPEHGRLCATC